MFQALRKLILPIITIVLVFFLATIIFEWGAEFSSRTNYENANLAAVINGEEISWQTYNRFYQNLYQTEAQKTEDELPDTKIDEIQKQAWQQLLQDRLLMQEANKYNITVTDDELYAFLRMSPPAEFHQSPSFMTNGQFDYQKYVNALADPNYASFWNAYSPFAKNEIAKYKLQELIISAAHISEEEIKEFFVGSAEKVKVGIINVDFARFSRPPPTSTEEEMRAYFEEHTADYPIEERASLNVMLFEKKPQPHDWELVFNRAKGIYDSVTAGADFAELAKTYSDDGSGPQGGDLGWFPRGQMVEEFDRQVFNMQPGNVAAPIRTQFGWHIIKLHEFKDETEDVKGKKETVRKAHASHILLKVTPSQETLDNNFTKLEEFRAQAAKNGFFKAAQDLGLSVKTASPFFKNRNIQFLGYDPKANAFAFDNNPETISEIMENNSAQFVVQVAEHFPGGTATFEDAKQKLELDILKYKVSKICTDTAQAIYSIVQAGTDIEQAAKKYGEQYEILEPFSRGQYIPGIGRAPEAIGAAFSLKNPGDISKPTAYDQGAVIVRLLEKTSADLSEYTAKRDSISSALLLTKQQELYNSWFTQLVDRSEIVNNIETALAENREI